MRPIFPRSKKKKAKQNHNKRFTHFVSFRWLLCIYFFALHFFELIWHIIDLARWWVLCWGGALSYVLAQAAEVVNQGKTIAGSTLRAQGCQAFKDYVTFYPSAPHHPLGSSSVLATPCWAIFRPNLIHWVEYYEFTLSDVYLINLIP